MPAPEHEPWIGVISDTHGLLRPEVCAALRGASQIVHAGDIGAWSVVEELRELAPVTAVHGNADWGAWTHRLEPEERFEFGGLAVHLVHDLGALRFDPAEAGVRVVISGHTHRADVARRGRVLFLNPGTASPRKQTQAPTLARLWVERGRACAELVEVPST